ncbi:hypothetical protein [Streptomyces hydrogenans]|uniref:hypothetical protein n=1 Tax=Streptomyces hydrogenans TaxID=1873719 RepID=UPI0038208CD4
METTTSELQRLVRAGEERQMAWAVHIHGLPAGPEREEELAAWAGVFRSQGGTAEDVERMATCACGRCASLRGAATAWEGWWRGAAGRQG